MPYGAPSITRMNALIDREAEMYQ